MIPVYDYDYYLGFWDYGRRRSVVIIMIDGSLLFDIDEHNYNRAGGLPERT
jgi:hypothetical protein